MALRPLHPSRPAAAGPACHSPFALPDASVVAARMSRAWSHRAACRNDSQMRSIRLLSQGTAGARSISGVHPRGRFARPGCAVCTGGSVSHKPSVSTGPAGPKIPAGPTTPPLPRFRQGQRPHHRPRPGHVARLVPRKARPRRPTNGAGPHYNPSNVRLGYVPPPFCGWFESRLASSRFIPDFTRVRVRAQVGRWPGRDGIADS